MVIERENHKVWELRSPIGSSNSMVHPVPKSLLKAVKWSSKQAQMFLVSDTLLSPVGTDCITSECFSCVYMFVCQARTWASQGGDWLASYVSQTPSREWALNERVLKWMFSVSGSLCESHKAVPCINEDNCASPLSPSSSYNLQLINSSSREITLGLFPILVTQMNSLVLLFLMCCKNRRQSSNFAI